MPKSKRQKVVHLTQVEKKTREHKQQMFDEIRKCLDSWQYVYILSVENMRNAFLKDVREDWRSEGRLFWGKNRVAAKSIGMSSTDEYMQNAHEISKYLNGEVSLFFTNADPSKVGEYFDAFKRQDYARGGFVATETFVLHEGQVVLPTGEPLPPSLESQLRSLGVPSILKNGKVMLNGEYTVCKEGQKLTHEQARLLKMFYKQMAVFKVNIVGYYNQGLFTLLKQVDPRSAKVEEEIMLLDN